jgi:hypothetical protein
VSDDEEPSPVVKSALDFFSKPDASKKALVTEYVKKVTEVDTKLVTQLDKAKKETFDMMLLSHQDSLARLAGDVKYSEVATHLMTLADNDMPAGEEEEQTMFQSILTSLIDPQTMTAYGEKRGAIGEALGEAASKSEVSEDELEFPFADFRGVKKSVMSAPRQPKKAGAQVRPHEVGGDPMDMQNQMQQSRNKKFTEGAKPSKQRAASR